MTWSSTKSEGAFRTIREVSDWLGVPTHVLRFWESKFEHIAPVKGAGGRRYYRPDDMRLLGGIKVMLHDQGLTIRAVCQKIDDDGTEPVMALSPELQMPDRTPPRTRKVIREAPTSSAEARKDDSPAGDTAPPPESGEVVPFSRGQADPQPEAEPELQLDLVDSGVAAEQEDADDPIGDALANMPQPDPAPAADATPTDDTELAATPAAAPPVAAAPSSTVRLIQRADATDIDRLKLRRLHRRLRALADEVREDLTRGTLR